MARLNWRTFWPAAGLTMATMAGTPANAQSLSQPRFEISANAGALTEASKGTESHTFASNGGENETLTVDRDVKTAFGFNVGAAVRIVPQFWVGAQFAMAEMKPSASVTAVIPHPLLFNAPRTVQGSINGVAHNEQNIHVDLMYALPIHALDLRVM